METTSAPAYKPTTKIADSEIPGIEIIRPSDPGFSDLPCTRYLSPNGFVIRNEANCNVATFAVTYVDSELNSSTKVYENLEFVPGEAIPIDSPLPDSIRAHIEYLLFDDGSYYGPDFYAQQFMADEIASEAAEAKEYLRRQMMRGTPLISAEEWEHRIALVERQEAATRRGGPCGLIRHDKWTPKIKSVTHLSTDTYHRS